MNGHRRAQVAGGVERLAHERVGLLAAAGVEAAGAAEDPAACRPFSLIVLAMKMTGTIGVLPQIQLG